MMKTTMIVFRFLQTSRLSFWGYTVQLILSCRWPISTLRRNKSEHTASIGILIMNFDRIIIIYKRAAHKYSAIWQNLFFESKLKTILIYFRICFIFGDSKLCSDSAISQSTTRWHAFLTCQCHGIGKYRKRIVQFAQDFGIWENGLLLKDG